MNRHAVLSVRMCDTPTHARRHLELVGRLERELEADGGRLVGFGASCFSFAFPEEQLSHAVGLARVVLNELGEQSVGISLRELVWDTDNRRAWGLALVLSETLAQSARPGEVLVDPEIRELGSLVRRSTARVQLGDVVLRANLCTQERVAVSSSKAGSSAVSSSRAVPPPPPTDAAPAVPSLPTRRLPPPERGPSGSSGGPLPASIKEGAHSGATLGPVEAPMTGLSEEEPEPKTQRFSKQASPPPKPSTVPKEGAKSNAAPPPKPSSRAAPPKPGSALPPRPASAAPPLRPSFANPPKAPSRALSSDSAPTQPRSLPPPLPVRTSTSSRAPAGTAAQVNTAAQVHSAAQVHTATQLDTADEEDEVPRAGTAADRHSHPPPKPKTNKVESLRPERPSVVDALRSGNPDSMLRLADRLKGEGGQDSLVSRLEAMAKLANGDIVLGLAALREAARVAMDTDSKNQARAILALAVGFAMAGRKQEALLQGLEALSRARARGDERGEVACTTFIGQLSKASGEADVTNAWLSLHADTEE